MNGLYSMEQRLFEIKSLIEDGKKPVLYGAGEKCRDLLLFLEEHNIIPYCICDSDSGKWGSKFGGGGMILYQ